MLIHAHQGASRRKLQTESLVQIPHTDVRKPDTISLFHRACCLVDQRLTFGARRAFEWARSTRRNK